MVERGRGCIINIITGVRMAAIPYGGPYLLSKGAVALLTEYMAAEAGPHGVRAFAVGPGAVRTEMARYLVESPEGRRYLAWFHDHLEQQGRPPEDAARLCLAVALGRADALSGRVVSVADDLVELTVQAEEIRQQERRVLRMQT